MNVLLIMETVNTHATIFPVATHVAVIQDTCSRLPNTFVATLQAVVFVAVTVVIN